MDRVSLKKLLEEVGAGSLSVAAAMEKLKTFPFQDLGFAKIDTHRHLRKGFPEVVLAQDKTARQVIEIIRQVRRAGNNLLITRVEAKKAAAVLRAHRDLRHHTLSRTLYLHLKEIEDRGKGKILVITAGTSDIPVAEEAAVTAEVMGNEVERIYDVGVAGLHRLLSHHDRLIDARVLVVAAGMEGALPSVVSGLVERPVIAVPTSVGYGASFGGVTALLAMLNSCASGVTVVNIDNGFGAGYAASLMNRL
ncbi:MAG: nickel pincer cofactor biosynthesis protein LarB [bacterium]